jgi:hypothetical protein
LASLAPNRALLRGPGPAADDPRLAAIEPLDRSVEALEKKGQAREAQALAEFYAACLNRVGLYFKEEGDLTRAEPSLSQAHALCEKWLPPGNPNTLRVVNNLAGVYQAALNAPAPDRLLSPGAPPGKDRPRAQAAFALKTASDLRVRIARRTPREVKASVLPVLVRALQETDDPREKVRLARAIGELGPAARDAVPVLAECLSKVRDPRQRRELLLALGPVGPAAGAAAEELARRKDRGRSGKADPR